jgi:hypothetical protein
MVSEVVPAAWCNYRSSGNHVCVTSIGYRVAGALAPPVSAPADGHRHEETKPLPTAASRAVAPLPATWVRVGKVRGRSAVRYLVVWAVGLFFVQLVVLVTTYVVLWSLGVTGSISRALAVVNDQALPASGVLPMLQPQHVLLTVVLVSLATSLLFFVAAVGVVLVHNATTTLTGGITVRVRPLPPRGRQTALPSRTSSAARR